MNMTGALMDAYYNLLTANNPAGYPTAISVPVYKYDVPEDEDGDYVLIYPETTTGQNNKHCINDDVVIVTDVVTVFENNANGDTAEVIDSEIFDRLLPTARSTYLINPSGMQILNLERDSSNVFNEADGKKVYHRKVSRYKQRINQTAVTSVSVHS